jgi:hypothetical protein
VWQWHFNLLKIENKIQYYFVFFVFEF